MKKHGYKIVLKSKYPDEKVQEIMEGHIKEAIAELGGGVKTVSYVCGMTDEEIEAVEQEFKDIA